MKKTAIILLTTLLAFTMVFASPVLGTLIQATPRIYLSPSENVFYTSQTNVGHKFNVTVWVQDAPETGAWQVYCEFNDTIVNVTRWYELTNDAEYIFYGKTETALPAPPNPDYVHLSPGKGRLSVGALLFPLPPAQPPSNGTGKLCILEFVITTPPPVSGALYSAFHIDENGTYLLDEDGNSVAGIAREDGAYGFIYNTPPLPRLAVNPNSIEFRPYHNILNKQFNVSLSANNIDSSLHLKTVSLSLSYNQSLLSTESSNTTLDSLWNGANNVTVSEGKINVTVTNPSSTPSGNVLVANISFTVLQQGTTPPQILGSYMSADLEFVHQVLLNSSDENISQDPPINGSVKIYAYATVSPALVITEPTVISDTDDTLLPNTSFYVNVMIDTTWQVQFIQLRVQYEHAILNWTGLEGGAALGTYGTFSADNFRGESQIPTGSIKINITFTTIPQTLAGSVAKLTFQCLSIGNCTMNLTDTLVIDSIGNNIPVTYVQRDVIVIPEFPLGYALPMLICLTLVAVAIRKKFIFSA